MTRTDNHMIVSIDFGTSNSGFAFIESTARLDMPDTFTNYKHAPVPTPKCPTAVLYDNGIAKFFGFTALVEGAKSSSKTMVLIRNFKVALHKEDQPPWFDVLKKTANEVTVDFLKLFKICLLEAIQTKHPEVNLSKIRWCLTVPAISTQQMKWEMHKIAVEAGLVSRMEDAERDVVLVSEPEAAAIYCQRVQAKAIDNQLNEGQTFMVVDAGGGTVDLTMYTIRDGAFVEVVDGKGDWCGGMFFDEIILKRIGDRLGADEWARFKKEHRQQFHDIERAIEQEKRTFDESSPMMIAIPGSVKRTATVQAKMKALQGDETNYFSIGLDEIMKDLKKLFTQTTSLIGVMFKAATTKRVLCQRVFLVGGFSSFALFRSHVSKYVKNSYPSCVVHQPQNPQAAIVLGAAIYLTAPDTFVTVRCARYTYGVTISRPLNSNDPSDDPTIFEHTVENRRYIKSFDIFVVVGEEIPVNRVVEHPLYPLYDNQKTMEVTVLLSSEKNPCYVTEQSVNEVCRLTVNMPDLTGGRSRCVLVSFMFGAFDIHISAKKEGTDEVVKTTTSYDIHRRRMVNSASSSSETRIFEPLQIESPGEDSRREGRRQRNQLWGNCCSVM